VQNGRKDLNFVLKPFKIGNILTPYFRQLLIWQHINGGLDQISLKEEFDFEQIRVKPSHISSLDTQAEVIFFSRDRNFSVGTEYDFITPTMRISQRIQDCITRRSRSTER
jgi:hypothetical protein